MKKLISYKSLYRDIFLLIITLFIWASVGSKYHSMTNLNEVNIKTILNNIRFFFPLIIIIFLIIFKSSYQKSYFLTNIIFFIFLSFLIGNYNLYFNNNSIFEALNNDKYFIQTGYLPNLTRDVMMGIYFMCSYLIFSRLNKKETIKLLKINYIFLIFISFITLYFAYVEYFGNNKEYLYFTQFLITGELFGVPTIRSLGLSRNLLIIFLPLAIFYLYGEKKKFNFLIILLLIFLSTNIFQLQSRTSIYAFFLFFLINFLILVYKHEFKKIISIAIIFIIIPQFLNIFIPNFKKLIQSYQSYEISENNENKENQFSIISELNIKIPVGRIFTTAPNNPEFKKIHKDDQYILISEYSSGRLELWRQILKLFKDREDLKNSFLGFGNSADRFFIKESASNSIFYSLISGGLFGLFFLILFYFYILRLIYYFLKNKEKYSKDIIIFSLIAIIIFIMLRSLVESSFLVFGTDNIVLFMCLLFLNNKKLT